MKFNFPHYEEIGTPTDESRLPAMPELDQDRAVAAEIAVERGVATPEQEDYIREDDANVPVQVESSESVEVLFSEEQIAEGPAALSYHEEAPDGLMFSNPDGSVTHYMDARPDPRGEQD